ncbi:MAG: hypothetical protein JOZ33_14595 [Acidobacteriaceae bacterium]|nr:hypothetical protein [Acidobacteriaceae bacterium]
MADEYRTIFEISHKGFAWWFALAGLVPAIVAAVLWTFPKIGENSWRIKWVKYFMPVFALIWVIGVIPTWLEYTKLQRQYRRGVFSVVQGRVEDFHPMPPQGHSEECFTVEHQRFCYSENIVSAGFNNDSAHGGPIRAGLPVRIAYVGNNILRLDVRTDATPR